MSLGRRDGERQQELWVATHKVARSGGHPFYVALNRRLARAGFDRWVEGLCEPYYADGVGRPSIPPGTYFRMLMVGYFEGIDSQRGIAWRCADSLALREFLGASLTESTPDHSSMSRIRQRLPLEVYGEVFSFVHRMAAEEGLLGGKALGVDATTLEANAAMKSIVRKDTGEGWTEYVRRLMEEDQGAQGRPAGPTQEDVRRYDRRRGSGKKVSNSQWHSPTDPDARITKMKDGRTRLGYKAVHAVDLESGVIVSAEVEPADRGDAETLLEQVEKAEDNLFEADAQPEVKEVVADKGYHKAEVLAGCATRCLRTYIPERQVRGRRRWGGEAALRREAVYANRRRTRSARGRRLQRRRSEVLERSFAHLCETGGARRAWLRGLVPIRKAYLIRAAAHNLSVVMRKVCGQGKPRAFAAARTAVVRALCPARLLIEALIGLLRLPRPDLMSPAVLWCRYTRTTPSTTLRPQNIPSSTGC